MNTLSNFVIIIFVVYIADKCFMIKISTLRDIKSPIDPVPSP